MVIGLAENWGKLEIELSKPLGVAKPFKQGGVWRLTIPKKAVKVTNLEAKEKGKGFFSFVFFHTNKGLLLLDLDELVNPEVLKLKLGSTRSMGDISNLSPKHLENILREALSNRKSK